MTEQNDEQRAILFDRDGGVAYAVPLSVLEAHRATPEQRAEAAPASADVAGFTTSTQEAGDPQEEAPLYALTAEQLEPYRLSDEEARAAETAAAAEGDDTSGYFFDLARYNAEDGTFWFKGPFGWVKYGSTSTGPDQNYSYGASSPTPVRYVSGGGRARNT